MAKADRVSKVVTAAVIEALGKDQSGLVAEITADVLEGEDDDYSNMFRYAWGGGTRGKTHLERVAREQVKQLANEAIAEWFAERADDLKAKVREKLDLDAIADSYTTRLLEVMSSGSVSVNVNVEYPSQDSDDD